jgi:uncharacterized protein YcaQ
MLWDRKLIKEIFGFEYKWEIYTPQEQRKYGYYVLPVLSGDRFVARAELIRDRQSNTLLVKNIWFEQAIRQTAGLNSSINSCLKRFTKFHELDATTYYKIM